MAPAVGRHDKRCGFRRARGVLFSPDVVSFGTLTGFMSGLQELETLQWRKIWPTHKGFQIRRPYGSSQQRTRRFSRHRFALAFQGKNQRRLVRSKRPRHPGAQTGEPPAGVLPFPPLHGTRYSAPLKAAYTSRERCNAICVFRVSSFTGPRITTRSPSDAERKANSKASLSSSWGEMLSCFTPASIRPWRMRSLNPARRCSLWLRVNGAKISKLGANACTVSMAVASLMRSPCSPKTQILRPEITRPCRNAQNAS